MNIELSVAIIAICAVTFAVVALIVGVRLAQLAGRVELLTDEARTTLSRVNRLTAQVEQVVEDAQQLTRATRSIGPLLDQVTPPLRIATALLGGVRAGIGSLFRSRR